MKRKLIPIVICLSLVACAGHVKPNLVKADQSIHALLVSMDDAERTACQPDPAKLTHCTLTVPGLSDAVHQKFSGLLAQAFEAEVRFSTEVKALPPGAGVSKASLESLRVVTQQIKALAESITPNASLKRLLDLTTQYIDLVVSILGAYGVSL